MISSRLPVIARNSGDLRSDKSLDRKDECCDIGIISGYGMEKVGSRERNSLFSFKLRYVPVGHAVSSLRLVGCGFLIPCATDLKLGAGRVKFCCYHFLIAHPDPRMPV